MCGFVGQLNGQVTKSQLEYARDLLAHRGPDDTGFFSHGPISFGFRRLAILDRSPAGHQPMTSEDQKTTIVFNGEIYNYIELREELLSLGRKFHTGSDTEVILAAYAQWGLDCFARMNGMWAIALWDDQKKELHLSRDRFGEKPLYWSRNEDHYVFGSEIKALLALGAPAKDNSARVVDYLVYGYLDHTTETMYDGIFQVQPGAILTINEDGDQSVKTYWTLKPKNEGITTAAEASAKYRQLFYDSVKLRLRSDVPIGSCLSGGLDSASIVAVAHDIAHQSATHLEHKTFTAYAEDKKYDEREYSRVLNKKLSLQAFELEPDPTKILSDLPLLLWHQDEPFLSLSMYAQWLVMKRVRQEGVTVVLDGQGGDETLAGYMPYFGSLMAQLIRSGRWVRAWREWQYIRRNHPRSIPDILPSLVLYLVPSWLRPVIVSRSGKSEIRALRPNIRKNFFHAPSLPQPFSSQLKNHLYRLLTGPGLRALLHSEDRNSMAASVESRVPFLDHRLAEFTLGLPDHLLISNGVTKPLLRQALSNLLPPAIRDRRDKMGFVVPQQEWMRTVLRQTIEEALLAKNPRLEKYLDLSIVRDVVQDFMASKNNQTALVWRWYAMEYWLQRLGGSIDRPASR